MTAMKIETHIRRKTRYHHGDLRAQLIEATRQIVEEAGPDHFSVSQACRVAGVSTAAPYRHFRDREEMLSAVTLDGMARHYTQMVAALEGVPPATPERAAPNAQAVPSDPTVPSVRSAPIVPSAPIATASRVSARTRTVASSPWPRRAPRRDTRTNAVVSARSTVKTVWAAARRKDAASAVAT